MPLEVSIKIAAKEAAQEAETFAAQKVKKDKHNAQKRKSYAGLSGEKKRAQRARRSEGNKCRQQNKSKEELAAIHERDRLRKKQLVMQRRRALNCHQALKA